MKQRDFLFYFFFVYFRCIFELTYHDVLTGMKGKAFCNVAAFVF